MSISEMRIPIQILSVRWGKDEDGFRTAEETIVTCVRAKKEDKNVTEKWQNRTTLQSATAIFTFRHIPGIEITSDMVIICGDKRYDILSVENVRQRNMYTQVVAGLEVTPDGEDDS